jgi:UV DNA damage endonuclease
MNLGYACINKTLNESKERVTTNRSMIKRTFTQKGISYASELAVKNCRDLSSILEWNEKENIRFFRLSSNLFPWSSEYNLEDLPDYELICSLLKKSGDYAKNKGHRITTHPGPFNVLGSPNEKVVESTIKELSTHASVFDLMGLEMSTHAKINIHVGGMYGDAEATARRWIKNFKLLPESVKSRLTLENDDKASMWSVFDLYNLIYKKTKTPIVFDYHHHKFCAGNLSEREALEMALSTWDSIKPVVHYSQSRSEEKKDSKIQALAHSDSYWEAFDLYGNEADVMLECKDKEQGLFQMRELLRH